MERVGCLNLSVDYVMDNLRRYGCTDIYLHFLQKAIPPEQNNTVYLRIKTYKMKVPTRRISIPQAKAISISNINHIGVSVGEDSTDKIWRES